MPNRAESTMQLIIAGFFATLTAASFLTFASFAPVGIFSNPATEVSIITTEGILSDGNATAVVSSASRPLVNSSGFTYNNTALARSQFPILPNALVSGGMFVSRFFLSLVYGSLIGVTAITGPLIFQRLSSQGYPKSKTNFRLLSIVLAFVSYGLLYCTAQGWIPLSGLYAWLVGIVGTALVLAVLYCVSFAWLAGPYFGVLLAAAALGLMLWLVTIVLIAGAIALTRLFGRRYFGAGLGVIGFGFTLALVLKWGGGTPKLVLPAGIVLISFLVGILLYAATGRSASNDVDNKSRYLAHRRWLGQGSLTLGVALAIGGALTFGAETTSRSVPLATFVGIFFFPFAGIAAIEYYRMARLVRPADSKADSTLIQDLPEKLEHICELPAAIKNRAWSVGARARSHIKEYFNSETSSEADTAEAESEEE